MNEDPPGIPEGQRSVFFRLVALATGPTGPGRFVRFALVGLSGTGVNMGTFWLLTRVGRAPDLAAIIAGYVVATLSNFVLNDLWTFRDRRTKGAEAALTRLARFCVVSGVAIGIYYAIYIPLTRYLGVYDLLALAVAIAVGTLWNFSVNVLWTWRTRGRRDGSGG
ncbi:MAG: GtrA family protein [Dehalococcoidia bacterium]|nr:GtrA family protein [Dehalococcoidia bacterium]